MRPEEVDARLAVYLFCIVAVAVVGFVLWQLLEAYR